MEAFCRYFAEEKPKNSFEQIEQKRKKIMDMVEQKVGVRVTVANIRKIMTHDLMMTIIEKIDKDSNSLIIQVDPNSQSSIIKGIKNGLNPGSIAFFSHDRGNDVH